MNACSGIQFRPLRTGPSQTHGSFNPHIEWFIQVYQELLQPVCKICVEYECEVKQNMKLIILTLLMYEMTPRLQFSLVAYNE